MATHRLKIIPCYFEAVVEEIKKFEIRDNTDRGFQKGDIVILQEFDGKYTGKEIVCEITYVSNYEQKDNFVVFGFSIIKGAL